MPARKSVKTRTFTGANLDRVAFPLGGIGAGMFCLEGTGAFSHVSLRHQADTLNAPWLFAALAVKSKGGTIARVLEGPVPTWKILSPGGTGGLPDSLWGLPRFGKAAFTARFPFGITTLTDPALPVAVTIAGWSPFIPGDSENSCLPVAAIEYTFQNISKHTVDTVFSFHSRNLIRKAESEIGIESRKDGMVLWQAATVEKPWLAGWCGIATDAADASIDAQWFRGGWFDTKTVLWKNIAAGNVVSAPLSDKGEKREGGSIYVPVRLDAGEQKTIRIRVCWYVPKSDIRAGYGKEGDPVAPDRPGHEPWYARRFTSIESMSSYWATNYDSLRKESAAFADCFYDTTLPGEAVEAIAANLSILKSPALLRQHDGRMWIWEGCCDGCGCCHGSCTHVLNYAQALAHLFPDLERTLRRTEYNENQNAAGHQNFRSRLPIVENDHGFHAAADGQLGGIMKIFRDWRISGDTAWLEELWPKVVASLDYCIETWDPRHTGTLEEPHHNTYDIEFWGPDGMCTTFYLGALVAAIEMAKVLKKETPLYAEILKTGRNAMEKKLFNGEYFEQKVMWQGLTANDPVAAAGRTFNVNYSAEALELLKKEGPKYQYGKGCLSDGVLGAWMAAVCGLDGEIVDRRKITSHLRAVYRHNFKSDLSGHANPQRPTYALGKEAGLLLCTWPRGGDLTLPFVYSNEIWTGIEYQVATHLMMVGDVEKGLGIVRAVRARYDGRTRNPFDEFECGHWYTRALASYAMLQALTGIRYDAVDKTLFIAPRIKGDVRCFISTNSGYGVVSMTKGKPGLEVAHGQIPVEFVVINGKKKAWKQ